MAALRWGILGTASIATRIVDAIRVSEHDEIRAVASRSKAAASAWAAAHGIPESYGSYDQLLSSGSVDVVYIPLPNTLHAEWTVRALDAGLPVLCEKPLAADAAGAAKILAASERTGLPVVEGFMYRYHPLFETVRALLGDGIIGTVRTVTSRFTFLEDDRDSIVGSAALGGGALLDVGCYCVHFSRMIAGREPRRVAAAEVRGVVDDSFMGLLEFPGGLLAQFEASIVTAERQGAEIHGSTGSISIPQPWLPGNGPTRFIVQRPEQEDQVFTVPGANTYALEVADLSRAVRLDTAPRWPLTDALENLSVIDALFRAAQNGEWLELADNDESVERTDGYD